MRRKEDRNTNASRMPFMELSMRNRSCATKVPILPPRADSVSNNTKFLPWSSVKVGADGICPLQ